MWFIRDTLFIIAILIPALNGVIFLKSVDV